MNLLGNAVKYSPRGSTVRVRACAVPGAVELEVEDEGRGIAPEALPRVFEPYYREPGAASAAAGAGIGLAVVKSLVEAHGGEIRLDSAPARGTRVTVRWPAVP
ncbi:MAG: ATP-binding protein [Candidatus Rokubacteria bacterium]|nr:ATP-binding protein [Candidatus Rokubacteria bacterium]